MRQPWVHPAAATGQIFERSWLACSAAYGATVVEPTLHIASHHARALVIGHIGDATFVGNAIDVHQMTKAKGLRVGELNHQRATL